MQGGQLDYKSAVLMLVHTKYVEERSGRLLD